MCKSFYFRKTFARTTLVEGVAILKYAFSPGASFRAIEGEVFILNRETGIVSALNSSACFLWPFIEAGHPAGYLAERLCEEYDVDLSTAKGDVAELLDNLTKKGILVIDG